MKLQDLQNGRNTLHLPNVAAKCDKMLIQGDFMKLQDLQNARNTFHLLNVAANVHYHQLHGSLLNTEFSKDHLLAQVNCLLCRENPVFFIVTFSTTVLGRRAADG